jgi:hypothetical protein
MLLEGKAAIITGAGEASARPWVDGGWSIRLA